MGLDSLYVANEGRLVCFVPAEQADEALGIMRTHPLGGDATQIGIVGGEMNGRVSMTSKIGTNRVITMLSGEQLPRIC